MLLGNYNIFNNNPGRAIGGPSDPVNKFKEGSVCLFYHVNAAAQDTGTGLEKTLANLNKSAFNNGYYPPYTWMPAMKPGGMSSWITTDSTLALSMAGGVNAVAVITAGAELAATMQLVVSAVATITAGATLTGNLNAIAPLSAAITAGASFTATIQALGNAVAAITAGATLTGTPKAIGHMSATITSETELSPSALAAAVWNAVAADFNSGGTMGEKLNAAGGGSSPADIADAVWDEILSGHTDAGSSAQIVKAIKALVAAGL